MRDRLDEIFRQAGPPARATLIRLLGNFDLADDALQEAIAAAITQWPRDGEPENPTAWLIRTARFKAIDMIRKDARLAQFIRESGASEVTHPLEELDLSPLSDDSLRLIFMCCHPALTPEARVALTLREVCGLTTEEIAKAFLTSPTTLAQRIVRAKAYLRDNRVPYEVPGRDELAERLETVLSVIYLVFNEGYYASHGNALTREDLSGEAIRLARMLSSLLPEPEAAGLLALMLLQESRRQARADSNGDLILLEDQDRTLWNQGLLKEGLSLVDAIGSLPGPYALQAAAASVHMRAKSAAETDWAEIVRLYDRMLDIRRSSVVELNQAVAVAMLSGPESGLNLIDALLARGDLTDYGLAHSARADLCRRLGRYTEAKESYERALQLATQEPERRFIRKRLDEVGESLRSHG